MYFLNRHLIFDRLAPYREPLPNHHKTSTVHARDVGARALLDRLVSLLQVRSEAFHLASRLWKRENPLRERGHRLHVRERSSQVGLSWPPGVRWVTEGALGELSKWADPPPSVHSHQRS